MTTKYVRNHFVVVLLIVSAMAVLSTNAMALEFLCGAAMGGVNIALLIWVTERIMQKKGIALTLLAGVGKYFVLLAIFILAMIFEWRPTGYFVLGVASVLLSIGWLIKNTLEGLKNGSL
jgi:energy-converting hydrogenase Eha subunit B